MLNQKLKLNTKIFNSDVEKKSTRLGFGEGLLIAGTQNENIVGLCADLVESTKMNLFADKFPDRFIELGIAEQNLASVASGMASMGKIPFIASYAIYSPGRNWEQIRTTICFNGEPVKIIGTHAGLSVGPDGGSHQCLEDIALTRVLPNMVVISPCDAIEAKKATIVMSKTKSPTYLRCARNDTPIITTEETPFEIGKAQIVFQPENGLAQLGIIATGPSVYNALIVAKNLESEGIKVKVMNLSTIKPLDSDAIMALAKETKKIVTVEDHQIAGGMGGAVAECLAQNYPTRIEFVGVKDKFGQSGIPEELAKYYEIDQEAILRAVRKILK
ncbi:MAG: Transketolase, central region [Candidatus Nomurabacteria bacterium GW2011_GWF2_35_66]|uniref:Transketolase, central region n=1 Tax=Candidatus Nomurabacteria bacterium GW2011_GWE1_35_16 TaxID=1618761 RepID=A0A0G0EH69_9BACT|nr:MAG: Transketolase, central region [Candidatus Nomurabacteria bacterium GW2011_GWF1_34_20]KKP63390.1 MAG: Transketolase, central region [Candidatus Nomurabacteria bacterium GW2011_GWE2_34_25]KKP66582.1 MAG: Transketolase, central region [Candidatus Nomurabacteria bacterium GW2011_GWE1_35_16]KKP83628.1 MAG: Transketolase, central region [Candidatus Nomurabacteria bacterium GW2011_GWF2_35_66]HAE36888.1 transketolase [Candidatus Nomurabacteria bacterium]